MVYAPFLHSMTRQQLCRSAHYCPTSTCCRMAIYNTSYMSETDDSFTHSLSRQGVTLFQGRSGSWPNVKRQFRLQLEAGRYVVSSCHIDRRLVIKSGSSYIPGQLHACEPCTPCYHESTVPQNPLAATAVTARMFFLWELKGRSTSLDSLADGS